MSSGATTTRTTVAAVTLAAAGALAAGCSSLSGGGSQQPSLSVSDSAAPTTTSSTSAAPTTTASTTAQPTTSTGGGGDGGHACATSDLKVAAGHGNAGAGNHYVPLRFTNTGSAPCTMQGWPGVSYVEQPQGGPVGKPAHRSGNGGGAVTLQPGGSAVAKIDEVQVHNYDPGACQLTRVKGLRVYPPNNTASRFVPMPNAHACSGAKIPGEQLQVKPVQPAS